MAGRTARPRALPRTGWHAGGYFEGAFLVDPELAGRLREDLVVTLLVALAAVTLTTLCLHPIILSLNRNGRLRQSRICWPATSS